MNQENNIEQRIAALVETLNNEAETSKARTTAAYALGEFKAVKDPAVIKALLKALISTDQTVREAAASSLGYLKIREAVEPLIEVVRNKAENDRVRERAIVALSFIGDSRAVESLLEVLKNDDDAQNINVTQPLASLGEPALQTLLLTLSDQKNSVRERAIISLRHINDPKTVDALVQFANDESEDIELRSLAIYTLGYLRDRTAIEPLTELLDNEHKGLHDSAAFALSELKAEQSLAALIPMLKDASKRVRSDTISALYRLGDQGAVPPIMQVLLDPTEDEEVRADAAYALGQLGFVEAWKPLAIALEDKNWKVRIYAANALEKIKAAEAIEPLIKALQQDDVQTRLAAIQALESFTDEQAVNAVKKAKSNPLFRAADPDGKSTVTSDTAVVHYSFNLYADYGQFYLADAEVEWPDNFWTDQTLYDSLAMTPGFIAVGTARYNYASVEIEVWDEMPDNTIEEWDQVAECSIEIPSGKLVIDGCLSFRIDESPYIRVVPNNYRARVYYGGLESAAGDNPDGQDYYKIALWPGETREVEVIKRYWHPKADEYKLVKGKDRSW